MLLEKGQGSGGGGGGGGAAVQGPSLLWPGRVLRTANHSFSYTVLLFKTVLLVPF